MHFKFRTNGTGGRTDAAILERLRAELPSLSRTLLKDWIDSSWVSLSGRMLNRSHASQGIAPGEHSLDIARWTELVDRASRKAQAAPADFYLPIVYEDGDLLVLNKTTGVPSVPLTSQEPRTAVGYALAHWPALADVGRSGLEPGILHRLDTATSGLLVFAKTGEAYDLLHEQWKSGGVRKTYRAIIRPARPLPELPSTLKVPIAHDAKSSKRMLALFPDQRQGIRGNPLPAVTHLIRTHRTGPTCDLEVEIETGVMHQIRCHLSAIGLPVLGDPIYGQAEPGERLWLHAWKLSLPRPGGRKLEVEAPLPENWPKGP